MLGAASGFVYLARKGKLQLVKAQVSFPQSRQKLLIDLAQLDDDFADGKIREEDYRRLRAEKKVQLVTLMQRPKENCGREQ